MKASTLFGIILGFAAIFGAFIWEGGTINTLFMLPAMLIVFGGTFAAGIAGTSFKQFSKMPELFKIAIFPKRHNLQAIAKQIIMFSTIARKDGILALEDQLKKIEHPFMKKLIELSIDGTDPDTMQQIVETEIAHITHRHKQNTNLFTKMGGYSPTMGIIGTVMGLISTLAAAGSDPNVLIHHIASAFIATMWGIFMANVVWLPLSDKLKSLHDEEMQLFQLMLDGVVAIQMGETPTVVRIKIATAFPIDEQEDIMLSRNTPVFPKPIIETKEKKNEENANEKKVKEQKEVKIKETLEFKK